MVPCTSYKINVATRINFNVPHTEDCTGVAGMPCDENAMCEELPRRDNFTCTCIPPFVGDGFMCSRGE